MRRKRINIHRPAGHEIDRLPCAVVLSADVLQLKLLAAQRVGSKVYSIPLRNARQHQYAARLEQLDRLVERRLFPGALKHTVQPARFLLQNVRNRVPARRHACPVGTAALGQAQPVVEQIGDESPARAKCAH